MNGRSLPREFCCFIIPQAMPLVAGVHGAKMPAGEETAPRLVHRVPAFTRAVMPAKAGIQ
jgi:hypothetical protein